MPIADDGGKGGSGGGDGGGGGYNNNNSNNDNNNNINNKSAGYLSAGVKQQPTLPSSTTPFRPNSAQHNLRSRASQYVNSRPSLVSSSTPSFSAYLRPRSAMETPAPHPVTAVSTPRPGSRQSVASGASSSTSTSPPSSLQLLTAVVEHAAANAVAVVPSSALSTNGTDSSNNNTDGCVVVDPALDLPMFDKLDDITDITLEAEGRKLHAHRVLLVLSSPVFRAMLTGDFIERKQNVITLKDKRYDELLEFLQAIYPPWKPVSGANVRILLKFADEYRVDGLLRRCEDFLLALKMARDTGEQRLWAYDQGQPFCRVSELLGLANTFSLERLSRALVDYLSPRPLAWQMDGPDFFAYSGPQLENRILNRALSTALTLIDRNRYCDTVKELLHGHKVYFE